MTWETYAAMILCGFVAGYSLAFMLHRRDAAHESKIVRAAAWEYALGSDTFTPEQLKELRGELKEGRA